MSDLPDATNKILLELLAKARGKQGLSMEALGKRAGLDRTYVGLLERGKRQPTVVATLALCEALGLSLPDLLLRAERIVRGEDASDGAEKIALVPASPRRLADRSCIESDATLRKVTGLTADVIVSAIDDAYHTLDLLDRQAVESGAPPFAKLVELANLSAMLGNIVGGAIARHSVGRYERSGPHKYQDLRAIADGSHVEIKTALEDNRPKGHLSKAGHYLTLRYVLGTHDGSYERKVRGEVVHIWEVRFGYLEVSDFSESNTEGDSGKTAVVRREAFLGMERIYFDPRYLPYARKGPWGPRELLQANRLFADTMAETV
jgi:transcriptional regulator with XRE-family HTH domain